MRSPSTISLLRHFDVLAVASYEIVGGYEDGKLVERSFGFQFGDDADAGVDEDDEPNTASLHDP